MKLSRRKKNRGIEEKVSRMKESNVGKAIELIVLLTWLSVFAACAAIGFYFWGPGGLIGGLVVALMLLIFFDF